MSISADDVILLQRVQAMPLEVQYDIGVGNKRPVFIESSHDGLLRDHIRHLALAGLVAFSERREHFAESPRLVEVASITALGRHAVKTHKPEKDDFHD